MSGGNIAYHLRPNKAVERILFIELLNRIGRNSFNISDYRYIGFGGPFMEDFKALHIATRISKMTCLERDSTVQSRQEFNNPLSCVDFVLKDSSSFVDEYTFDGPCIVWLDFTSPGELKQQLDDTFNLVKQLAHGDIFKVTLNASVQALREDPGNLKPSELLLIRKSVFEDRVGVDMPANIKDSEFRTDQYPALLLRALHMAVKRGTNHSKLIAQPLTAFQYSDGTNMLTATGIILDPKKLKATKFHKLSRLDHWPFAKLDWTFPVEIDLPVLSTKERMTLEKLQPNGTVPQAQGALGAAIGSEGITPKGVKSFAAFYRVYPEFVKVSL